MAETAMRIVPTLPHYKDIQMEPDDVYGFLKLAVADRKQNVAAVLCDSHTDKPVGFALAYCVRMIFSKQKASHDYFLWIDAEWRSLKNAAKMYKNYRDWAKQQGAVLIDLSHTAGYESAGMDVLLSRNGFHRIGATYRSRS